MGDTLRIENLGQIKKADIEFGDLTVFVGPQAAGKSVALQLLKLIIDADSVKAELQRYGVDWAGQVPDFFDAYFGEGMRALWRKDASRITWNSRPIDVHELVGRTQMIKDESLFYVPAQRVLTLHDGWPRPFRDYSPGDPFVVRQFSERLRRLLEREFAGEGEVFPEKHRVRKMYRDLLNQAVFGGYTLRIDKRLSQKRLVLRARGGNGGLPFMVWSAGQREFMPLLLAFYGLMPPSTDRVGTEWVVIEEPEMGLHTRAISAVLLMTLGLLQRGYRVCLSTHSPYVLDIVWALNVLRQHQVPSGWFRELFGVPKDRQIDEIAESALAKTTRVYYFDGTDGQTRDISNLDPGATDQVEAGWGELSEFSGRVADVVARAVAEGE